MPLRSELTIISSNLSTELNFGTAFHDCLTAFQTSGAYSDLSLNSEKFLSTSIKIEFCKVVEGTLFGYYPVFVPTYVKDNDYAQRTPFFHFSNLADENPYNAGTALTIMLDKDEHAQIFLFTIAICLIQKGYRVFFTPDNTNSNGRIELTKESVAKHVNHEGPKQ
ncbi:hypothetical protein IRT38_01005 (plasmid) [Acinetobacter sp. SK-43]|uniref:hypothetical protein n=1 Tax=Acinetobacter sp. SK-43 TaxID=2785295 RepID=UPI00188AC89B|nr:hypothetical protein [Acinetobacter sp. SK-43]MBF4453995.1 hypothetical protein [Acinetobacter sp. SK-43]